MCKPEALPCEHLGHRQSRSHPGCLRHAPRSLSFAHRLLLPPRQDFPHISEFPGGSGSRSPGPSNPRTSGDWDSSYPSGECGISTCRSVLLRSRGCCPGPGMMGWERAGRDVVDRWPPQLPVPTAPALAAHLPGPHPAMPSGEQANVACAPLSAVPGERVCLGGLAAQQRCPPPP